MAGTDGSSPPLLEMRGISRRFPGVLALDHVDFDLRAGEAVSYTHLDVYKRQD